MKKSIIVLFLCLLIVSIGICCVSAADTNHMDGNTTVHTNDNHMNINTDSYSTIKNLDETNIIKTSHDIDNLNQNPEIQNKTTEKHIPIETPNNKLTNNDSLNQNNIKDKHIPKKTLDIKIKNKDSPLSDIKKIESLKDNKLKNTSNILKVNGPKLYPYAKYFNDYKTYKNEEVKPYSLEDYNPALKDVRSICKLLLSIYKDHNREDTLKIAANVLARAHENVTAKDLAYYMDGLRGKDIYLTKDSFGRQADYFPQYRREICKIEADKIPLSEKELKEYTELYHKCESNTPQKNSVIYVNKIEQNFVLEIYKHNDFDRAAEIAAKVTYEMQKNNKHFSATRIDGFKEMLNEMRSGELGGDYYIKIHDIEASKIPLAFKVLYPTIPILNKIHHLVGYLSNIID